jgi:hypothetical protein
MDITQENAAEDVNVEKDVIKKYAVRWAVLAAWHADLRRRNLEIPVTHASLLGEARIKIASGCFGSCHIGCVLSEIEGDLMSVDASTPDSTANTWVDRLGQIMSGYAGIESVLGIPAVKFQFSECGLTGSCSCKR